MVFSFGRRWRQRHKRDLSIVVVAYNMARELPRTLMSLSVGYQRDVHADDYEVIVVDNGSTPAVDRKLLEGLPGTFRLLRIDGASPSPAPAVNRGIAAAEGEIIGVMIDGARLVTPGLVHFARHAARLYPRAVVATLGWYLGFDFQRWSMRSGYDQAREDALLAAIEWPKDGYRLFEIATMDESSVEGWFQPIAESNALFMRRELWEKLGGMDERFDAAGGGYVNLDTFRRATELSDTRPVLLLGEATFHQLHGGVATNIPVEQAGAAQTAWVDQYRRIRRRDYTKPTQGQPPTYVGTLPRPALSHLVRAAIAPVSGSARAPLGPDFDRDLWSQGRGGHSSDPAVAAAIDLAQREFAAGRYQAAVAIARFIRTRAPEAREPQRLLSLVAGALEEAQPPNADADYFLAMAEVYRLLGEHEAANSSYRRALAIDPNAERVRGSRASSHGDWTAGRIGNYFPDRDQPQLSCEEADAVRRFHELYYRQWLEKGGDTKNLSWFGHHLIKCPLDLWMYQEVLVRTRPDVVVETGTWHGGSALYLAMIQDQIGHGRVITIDVEAKPGRPTHPRLTYLTGSSVDKAIVAQVRETVGAARAMVILDSDHSAGHVYEEIIAYSPLVHPGDYLIVEDSNVNGHPVYPDFGPGPMEAVDKFLSENDEFVIDERCERFLLTLNPRGYLRRKASRRLLDR